LDIIDVGTLFDNVCSGPVESRTQVLNTSILEIYTAYFANVSFNSALAMQEKGQLLRRHPPSSFLSWQTEY